MRFSEELDSHDLARSRSYTYALSTSQDDKPRIDEGRGVWHEYDFTPALIEGSPSKRATRKSEPGQGDDSSSFRHSSQEDNANNGGDPNTNGSSAASLASEEQKPSTTGNNREASKSDTDRSGALPEGQQPDKSVADSKSRVGDYSYRSEDWSWLHEKNDEPMTIKPLTDAERARSRPITDWELYWKTKGDVLTPEGKTWEQMLFEHEYLMREYEKQMKETVGDEYELHFEELQYLQGSSGFRRLPSRSGGNASLPDISNTFSIDTHETESRVYRTVSGWLGIPGEVAQHRDRASQIRISRGTGDDAGHLIANIFGAPGGEENLAQQNYKANRSGEWRKLEQSWANKLKNGVRIKVTVIEITRKGELRPFMRRVGWTEVAPNGRISVQRLDFSNPHTPSSRRNQGVPHSTSGRRLAPLYDLHRARLNSRRKR